MNALANERGGMTECCTKEAEAEFRFGLVFVQAWIKKLFKDQKVRYFWTLGEPTYQKLEILLYYPWSVLRSKRRHIVNDRHKNCLRMEL